MAFVLAAIGSAVGLGNLWRFPYVAATNGGGAFIFPYLFAILTAGIPILILEYTLGKNYKSGAPGIFAKINRKFEPLGWFQVAISFLIAIYYVAIVVWILCYIKYSFTLQWGDDSTTFFVQNVLQATSSADGLGGINTHLILPFVIVWGLTAAIMYGGINKGINVACKICLPILLACTVIIIVRGITLPGAVDGLAYMFTPDWNAIAKPDVWVAAYGQVFFSLSIAFGIMVSYASYLPEDEDVVNTAFLTACTNHGFEIFAGIGIFSVIGYMAYAQGVSVSDVAAGGIGLAFMVFPTAISSLPALNALFGAVFFIALFTAGITSMISILQAVISGVEDKWDMSHRKTVTCVLIPAFIISFLFITRSGLDYLDFADYIANSFGIVLAGVLEVLIIGWFFKPERIRQSANLTSNFSVGKWWTWCLKIVTLFVLGYTFVLNLTDFLRNGYGGYSNWIGGVFIAFLVISAIVFSLFKGKEKFYIRPDSAAMYDD